MQMPPEDGRNCLPGTVEEVAYHGSDLGVHVRVCDGRHILSARVPAGQADRLNIQPGEPVHCVWDAEHSRILPPS